MKIGFIFNAQAHQIFHSLPVACALAQNYPEAEVTVLARNQAQMDYLRSLGSHYDAAKLRYQMTPVPPLFSWLRGKRPPPKRLSLLWNLRTYAQFDALVMPERTSLSLRKMGLRNTQFIHTTHGAGDDERDWDARIRAFDLVLLPGRKRRDRMLEKGLLRAGHYFVSGYNKFDLVTRMNRSSKALFDNGRKTVLYNPHHLETHSSWRMMGRQVLDYFAASDQFNLIFAPHIRMRDDGDISEEELRPYRNLAHMRIDTGSPRSVDMSYSLAADIYLGDWSSQVYEFLLHPRPVVFLNPHQHAWQGREDYLWWTLGPVAEDISSMHQALCDADRNQVQFAPLQKAAFDYTFANFDQPAPERAADAIVKFLRDGVIEDDLA